VTQSGGANTYGTIFRVSTSLGFSKLFDFTGNLAPDPGANATTALMQHTNGDMYSVTTDGGAASEGNLYRLSPLNLKELLTVEGPTFVKPGTPVQFLGSNLTHVIQLTFGGSVQAQFQANSDNALTATVPFAALDGTITAVYDSGLTASTTSALHMLPTIGSFSPGSGPVGTPVQIFGGGFTSVKKVTFGGVATGNFEVISPSEIQVTVPGGAKTGKIGVTTPNGTASSPEKFTVN